MELPRLTVLNEQYAVRSILGEPGPFDAFYLAWDLENEEQVVVREFLPAQFVERVAPGTNLRPRGRDAKQIVEFGLKHLAREFSLTSKISHPNIVGLRNHFQENNTLYSIHDYHPGMPLQGVLDQHDGKISARTAITIMMPFMDGIRTGHNLRLIHGGISPQSIYLSKKGRPMVLAFNTTFLYLASRTQLLEPIQQPGFSPPEQYTLKGKHGPWSDVYSSAASLFTMLTGEVLPDAASRLKQDDVPGIVHGSQDLPDQLKAVLVKALSLPPNERPQGIDQFSNLLADSLAMPGVVSAPPSEEEPPRSLPKPPDDFQSDPGMPPEEDTVVPEEIPEPPAANTYQSPFTGNGSHFTSDSSVRTESPFTPRSSVTTRSPFEPKETHRDHSHTKKVSFEDVFSNGYDAPLSEGNGTASFESTAYPPSFSDSYTETEAPDKDFKLFPLGDNQNLPTPSSGFNVAKAEQKPETTSLNGFKPEATVEYNSHKPRKKAL